jgi:hypothetical protein
MKTETKIKKLTLNKETLRDLTAHHAGDVKGGPISEPGSLLCLSVFAPCYKTKGKTCNKQC